MLENHVSLEAHPTRPKTQTEKMWNLRIAQHEHLHHKCIQKDSFSAFPDIALFQLVVFTEGFEGSRCVWDMIRRVDSSEMET